MAFSLTKQEQTEREFHANELKRKASTLADALADYNGAVTDAQNFATGIAERLQSEYDGKSEAWQEGDRGSAVSELIGEWEGYAENDEIEFSGEIDHDDVLLALPTAAE